MNKSFLFERKSKFPIVKILLETKVRVNGLNLSKGKQNLFELSEFELSGVNYYKKHCQIQGELDLVRVSGGLLYMNISPPPPRNALFHSSQNQLAPHCEGLHLIKINCQAL